MKKIVFMMALAMCLTACGNNDIEENVFINNNQDSEAMINLPNGEEEIKDKEEDNKNTEIVENVLVEKEDKKNEGTVESEQEDKQIEEVLEVEKEEIEIIEEPAVEQKSYEEGVEIGEKAIDFEVELLSGEKVKLSNYLGKPVFLNFWATWCGPCVGEMPDIEKVKNEYGDKLVVLAINGGELKEDIKSFIDRKGYTFNVGVDEKGSILGIYDSMYIPLSVFIDKNGIIQGRQVGALSEEGMREIVENLVNME